MINYKEFNNYVNGGAVSKSRLLSHNKLFNYFCKQIESVPKLLEKALVIDKTLSSHFQDVKKEAKFFLQELVNERDKLLSECNDKLLPAVDKVIDELSRDVTQLQSNLESALSHIEQAPGHDWSVDADSWRRVYTQLQDHQGLVQKVIQVASVDLIDRSIRRIQDYSAQFLKRCSPEALIDCQERLDSLIQEPLKELFEMKSKNAKPISLAQTSEWLADIERKCADCAEYIFQEIDELAQEVHQDDVYEHDTHAERAEIDFMIKELNAIKEQINHLDLQDQLEITAVRAHLNDLAEHLAPFCEMRLPHDLKAKCFKLNQESKTLLERLPTL
jgi:hypothetical protein